MNKPKILIIGYGRSGKDTAAEFFYTFFNMRFKSSSEMANEILIFDKLKDKYDYKTLEECFNDRHNKRSEWFDIIAEYNKEDETKLASKILETNDCYVGMRRREEVLACKGIGLFDLIIWIDASDRIPPEDVSSCTVTIDDADIIVTNNTDLKTFYNKLHKIGLCLFR